MFSSHNIGIFENKHFWCGCVSLIDGVIEEIHTYEEAENWDFHHSLYFSPQVLDKMDNKESTFFFLNKTRDGIFIESGFREELPLEIINKIEKQILI